MATQGKLGEAQAGYNYVAQDKIWKDHVGQENTAAKKWPDNWNFLTTKYEDLVKDDYPRKERQRNAPPTPLQVPPVTPLEERVEVLPSSRAVPKTTSDMIGWRSTDPTLKLERYGGYAKPKGGLVRQLNWPKEAIS